MDIGLSLPYTYLSNNITRKDEPFLSALGPAEQALEELSSVIDYIEIANFDGQASPAMIVEATKNVWKQGLKVSLHPSLPADVDGKSLSGIYPWLPSLLSELNKYQKELVLNLHALSASVGDVDQLKKDSIKNLMRLTDLIISEGKPILISVELNRLKGRIDPCTTYEGVIEVCRSVDSPVLGIGWDFGHAFANYQNGLIEMYPPEAFLSGTNHTHIHDVAEKGGTHWPLSLGNVPLDENLRLLQDHEYKGLGILELQPEKFKGLNKTKELIYNSIYRLKAASRNIGLNPKTESASPLYQKTENPLYEK